MQGQRGQPRVSSPLMCRRVESPSPPQAPFICLKGFQENVPPNFLNIKVQHQGRLVPVCFIQVKMYDEPIVLGMMGQGIPVFQQYVHTVQTLIPSETTPYTHQEVLILHNRYPEKAWVNQALVNEGDKGLQAEVHRYRSLMDEADRKERKLSTLQDCLMDISLDLHANMQRLAEAEAIKCLEDRRAWMVLSTLVHPWQLEQGHSP